jgi:GNAT superfamily N-acetyltransferase
MRIAFLFDNQVLNNVVWQGPYGTYLGGIQVSVRHGLKQAEKLMKAARRRVIVPGECRAPYAGFDTLRPRRAGECSMTGLADRTALRISLETAELNAARIHKYLSEESYWARGLSRAVFDKALQHSLCFGGYLDDIQVAFARVITDRATFANLKDVLVFPEYRGRGYGIAIVQAVVTHPDLLKVAFTLGTNDAHGLYERFGFARQGGSKTAMFRPGSFIPRHKDPTSGILS